MALFRFRPLRLFLARFSTMEVPPEVAVKRKLPSQTRNHPDLLLMKCLESNNKLDKDMWERIREEMLTTKTLHVNPVNIDAVILDTCSALDYHATALDYCDYLKSQDYKFNLATTAKYFKLLTSREEPMSEKEKEDVIQLYEAIRKDYPLLDVMTAEACITGLSKTNKWKESLELLKMIEESAKPTGEALRAIVCAAFENNEPDLAWKLVNRIGPAIPPKRSVYRSFLEYATRVSRSAEELEGHMGTLFETLARWDFYPWLEVLEEIGGAFGKYGWTGQQTSISTNGVCASCGHTLSQLEVNKEDFEHLSNSFISRAIIGKDVYDKTNPMELARFKEFIEKAQPYDVVIDGLNVEYTLWNNHTWLGSGEKLAQVVRLFKEQGKKIVVLGRKHMLKWKPEYMKDIQNNARLFVAHNTSEDDPYLLYAALSGGLKTYLVSNDLMRQHKFILSDRALQKTFKFWLLTHQIHPTINGYTRNKTIFLVYPPTYLPVAQKDDNGWHIPCMDNHLPAQSEAYDLSQPWYCLRKRKVVVKKEPKVEPLRTYAKR
ncbi:mitochondrial ribonuclease P catalytic subunit [Diachasma alloeum]|uniref:mitochondrial ribonuclease P catalytic subunit n=1 Tax=Diachasma alloeum TaxID=454923 RepID=UPI00073843C8|nr:mitochondrial ribonuclease P catalytic subunit [Diachasma alloeum]